MRVLAISSAERAAGAGRADVARAGRERRDRELAIGRRAAWNERRRASGGSRPSSGTMVSIRRVACGAGALPVERSLSRRAPSSRDSRQAEEARVEGCWRARHRSAAAAAPMAVGGRYPIFVIAWSGPDRGAPRGARNSCATADGRCPGRRRRLASGGADGRWPALCRSDPADSAGFVLASTVLFWLTARAFDDTHPWRDLPSRWRCVGRRLLLFVRAAAVVAARRPVRRRFLRPSARRCSRRSSCWRAASPAP